MAIVGRIIVVALAIALLFLMLPTVILPSFSTSYRFAQSTCWTNTTANCNYDTTVNSTPLTATQNSCGATEYGTGTDYCQRVLVAGGYRSSMQAVVLLVFIVACVGFALYFIKRK